MAIAITFFSLVITLAALPVSFSGLAQVEPPVIIAISPTSGPEGTRVEITGINLAGNHSFVRGQPGGFQADLTRNNRRDCASQNLYIYDHGQHALWTQLQPISFCHLQRPANSRGSQLQGWIRKPCAAASGFQLRPPVGNCHRGRAGAGIQGSSGRNRLDAAFLPSQRQESCAQRRPRPRGWRTVSSPSLVWRSRLSRTHAERL